MPLTEHASGNTPLHPQEDSESVDSQEFDMASLFDFESLFEDHSLPISPYVSRVCTIHLADHFVQNCTLLSSLQRFIHSRGVRIFHYAILITLLTLQPGESSESYASPASMNMPSN